MQSLLKTPTIAHQNTRICRQEHPQLQARIAAIAGKNNSNCRQSAITQQVNSHANCRKISLHPAGEVICNLLALICVVACILREVLASQVKRMWGLFTSITPRVKYPAFASNATMSKRYHLLRASYNGRRPHIGSIVASGPKFINRY